MVGGNKRSRLPDVINVLLRVPALPPKALAARLRIASQTDTETALLRELHARHSQGGGRQGELPGICHLKTSAARAPFDKPVFV